MRKKQEKKVQLKTHQDWFSCYRLPGRIFAIREELHWQNVTSFLILGNERAVLFDTGMGIKDIRAVAEELYDGEIIVINSHCHFDHVGGNWQFDSVRIYNDPYSLKIASFGISAEQIADQAVAEAFLRGYPKGFVPERYGCRPFCAIPAEDGETFDLGDRTLEYIHTPGHSQDCAMLYDRKAGILLCGDMIYPGPLFAQFDDNLYGRSDLNQYIASLEKVTAFCPELKAVYMSHERCIAEPAFLRQVCFDLKRIRSGEAEGDCAENGGYGYESGALMEYSFEGYSVVVRK